MLFPPQICPYVKDVIGNLEQHLQAMNGIAIDYYINLNLNLNRKLVK